MISDWVTANGDWFFGVFMLFMAAIAFYGVVLLLVEGYHQKTKTCSLHLWFSMDDDGDSEDYRIYPNDLGLEGEVILNRGERLFRRERRCLRCSRREYYNELKDDYFVVPGFDGKGTRRY